MTGHTHTPYCRVAAQACNALGSSCKSYTRSAIISRNQSRLKPVERAGKQTAVRRASAQPGQETGVPRIGGSEVERHFRLATVEIASPSCGVRTTISGISSWLDGEERARDPRSLTWCGTAAGQARTAERAVRYHCQSRTLACNQLLRASAISGTCHNAREPKLGVCMRCIMHATSPTA